MRYDHQLYLYLESFKITTLDQFNFFKAHCRLCRLKLDCVTVTFEHIKSGYILKRNLCGGCRDAVRTMHQQLLAHEDPYE